MSLLPWIGVVWLFGIGLYGIVTSRHFVHLTGCLAAIQSSSYLLLLAIGYRYGAVAPIFYDKKPGTQAVDPVVQALVLTDVVIGATVSALLLALILQLHKHAGTVDPQAMRPMGRAGVADGRQRRGGRVG
ncbi:dehydrogenase [Gluconacetobacter tumulisoli]|uniref:Dehydrogenase n=1 Tax=Gluconacetobacter tumulisoli TaxID=1286189 RepID=A0A7W4PQY5_9PROT|nr:dehydrogenase [Gluconacetobacter tumulisoli]